MLTKDYHKRISAEEALNDVWFQKSKKMNGNIGKEALINLRNFHAKSKIQQAIYFFLIN